MTTHSEDGSLYNSKVSEEEIKETLTEVLDKIFLKFSEEMLVGMAREMNIEAKGTKEELINRIINNIIKTSN